jgi:hypothetical protein
VSKNVAVFVDVANIFYAAKAAGVDIDYVTLLKSATAGRDLVRAYAYTGLDPENENQKQFHGFLARSGCRRQGHPQVRVGVKANLGHRGDLMRMAEKLDVAAIVSGDGDCPAIYAVQQQGVRWRSSASAATPAAISSTPPSHRHLRGQAEKGVRSGRRVAARVTSMTEVPDKESGVVPRCRRRDVDEKPERPTRRRGSRLPERRGGPPAGRRAPGRGPCGTARRALRGPGPVRRH